MARRPACIYQPECPGCPRFGESGLDPLQLRRLEELCHAFGPGTIQQLSCDGLGHRFRARLSVRGEVGNCRIGIFEAGSHRLVHIPDCPVHHEVLREFLPRFLRALNGRAVEPYRESSHTGLLRGVQFAVERSSRTLQIVLLVRDELIHPGAVVERLAGLIEDLEGDASVHSVWLGALPRRSNSLLALRYEHIAGPLATVDEVGGARVHYPPDAFGQANQELHDAMVDTMHARIPPGVRLVEYYAGVGTVGLGCAKRGHEVLFNEVGPGSLRGLRMGWKDLLSSGAVVGEALVFEGRAGDHASLYDQQDWVIVDPPRKGLDPELLQRLLDEPPASLIYLSCGLASLEREATLLRRSGRLELEFVAAATYFPFTRHVESLLHFVRT